MKNRAKNLPKIIIRKINSKSIKIGIVGLGFVGLPLAIHFAKKGFKVCGYDKDNKKIKKLKNKKPYISTIKKENIESFFKKNNTVTSNSKELFQNDVIIICLPTPLKINSKIPDLSYIINFIEKNKGKIKQKKL